MNARIVINIDGTIAVFIDDGTVAQAQKLSDDLLRELRAEIGIDFNIAQPEQHRHGPGFEHQHTHTHNGATHAHSH